MEWTTGRRWAVRDKEDWSWRMQPGLPVATMSAGRAEM